MLARAIPRILRLIRFMAKSNLNNKAEREAWDCLLAIQVRLKKPRGFADLALLEDQIIKAIAIPSFQRYAFYRAILDKILRETVLFKVQVI